MEAIRLMKELKTNFDQEINYLPKEAGLALIESTQEVNFLQLCSFEFNTKIVLHKW